MAATDTVPQPPYSTELLADLHAGNMPDHLSRRLWPQVRRDPEAMRYLRALDGVNDELRALGRDERMLHPMPAEVTARLERMIDDLSTPDRNERSATVHRIHPDRPAPLERDTPPQPGQRPRAVAPRPAATAPMPVLSPLDTGELTATDLDLDPAEFDRDTADFDAHDFDDADHVREPAPWSGRLRWITAIAAAVALIAGAFVAADAMRGGDAAPTAHPVEMQLGETLSPSEVLTVMGRNEVTGPLASREALTGCLRAAGLDRGILGSRNVTYSGRSAVLVLLTGPNAPTITAVVLGTNCGPDDAQLLANADIG
ncbi:hypothetical protein [Nocardia sp. NPDC050406]|uniref:hypothetical protein n=1 Tax=Nocardia sp. NPDC050406 TaxID=3364318 RepID=UPI0037BC324E